MGGSPPSESWGGWRSSAASKGRSACGGAVGVKGDLELPASVGERLLGHESLHPVSVFFELSGRQRVPCPFRRRARCRCAIETIEMVGLDPD